MVLHLKNVVKNPIGIMEIKIFRNNISKNDSQTGSIFHDYH